MDGSFKPFIFLLLAGVLGEVASAILILSHNTNAPAIKIYSLVECLLILILFFRWGLFRRRKQYFYLLVFICIIFWVIEEIIFGGLFTFLPFFRIFYSFVIVLISINLLNYVILLNAGKNLFTNARFLICIAFIIFFTYQILYEAAFFISQGSTGNSVTDTIISLFAYINLLANLIFIPAVYFIPCSGAGRFDKSFNFGETFE